MTEPAKADDLVERLENCPPFSVNDCRQAARELRALRAQLAEAEAEKSEIRRVANAEIDRISRELNAEIESWQNERNHARQDCDAAMASLARARKALGTIAPAVENLACHQVQCDEDGVMVLVSRQAVDEVVNAINQLAIDLAALQPDGEKA